MQNSKSRDDFFLDSLYEFNSGMWQYRLYVHFIYETFDAFQYVKDMNLVVARP